MQSLIYQTLCTVQLRHDYFLNRGEVLFNDMDEADKAKQLQEFDWRESLHLYPIGNTQKKLKNSHLLLKHTPHSFRILVRMLEEESQEPFVSIQQEETLLFGVSYQNPLFENFSDMEFLGDRKIVWANNLPILPGFDSLEPLSVQSDQYFSASHIVNESEFTELMHANNVSDTKFLKGILSLKMNGLSGPYNILNETGTVKLSPTVFYINFRNRRTIWKYLQAANNFSAETLGIKPLTKSGFVAIDPVSDFMESTEFPSAFQLPNPSIHSLKRVEDKIISEIYL